MWKKKIDPQPLWKYFCIYTCTHMQRWFCFPPWMSISFVTMFWNFTAACLGLLSSVAPSVHLYPLKLEAHILHFWDIFFYYVFTFSLLSNVFWTSYSGIGPLMLVLKFLFSYFLPLCPLLSGRFLQSYNSSIHFFISVVILLVSKFSSVFNGSILFMHAIIQYFLLICISEDIYINDRLFVSFRFYFPAQYVCCFWLLTDFHQMFIDPRPFTHKGMGL